MKFNSDQKFILNYFFTSSQEDDTIYAAKQTLPQEIIGYIIGRASRAPNTFREIFLGLWEDAIKITGVDSKILMSCFSGDTEYNQISKNLQAISDKSINFLSKFRLHNSLRDVPHVAVFCDELSILQTKVWEHEVVAEYQEKSTRYRPFIATNVYLPCCSEKLVGKIKDGQQKLIDTYNDIYEKTGKRDLARYLLPVGSKTAMACMASIRSWERIVGRMISYPTFESKHMGNYICNHIHKAIPGALNLDHSFCDDMHLKFKFLYEHNGLASFISREQKVEVSNIKNAYVINGLIDIGAHRDLQRHRSVIQNFPDYRPSYGYDRLIKNYIPAKLYKEYSKCMKMYQKLFFSVYEELKETDIIGESQYVALLGHMTSFSYIIDDERWKYIYDLRTGSGDQQSTSSKTVHFSYSTWCHKAQELIRKIQEKERSNKTRI